MGLFDLGERLAIWQKARMIPGREHECNEWRLDDFNNVICYSQYGDRSAPHGWEYDHAVPNALGGLDTFANKRPLHHRANAGLGGLLGNALRNVRR